MSSRTISETDLPVASPEAEGVDAAALEKLDDYVASKMPELHSLVIVRNGNLVWERYIGGNERDLDFAGGDSGAEVPVGEAYPASFDASQVHNVKSVTKCFMSALIGIAIAEGYIESVDTTIGELLRDHFTDEINPRKKEITVSHLLKMRSGLIWDELGYIILKWMQSGDPIGYTLRDQSPAYAPDTVWEYSTADTHLLSACLTKATGMSALEFADSHLFSKLGITERRWTVSPDGYNVGGSELCLRPRDMAKFGQLYLQDGRWNDEQLVPAEWVELTIAHQPDVFPETALAYVSRAYAFEPGNDLKRYREGYGHKWWRATLAGHSTYYAAGMGGQYIFVFDDLDLVVVQTASSLYVPENRGLDRAFSGYRLMEDVVLPAIG